MDNEREREREALKFRIGRIEGRSSVLQYHHNVFFSPYLHILPNLISPQFQGFRPEEFGRECVEAVVAATIAASVPGLEKLRVPRPVSMLQVVEGRSESSKVAVE